MVLTSIRTYQVIFSQNIFYKQNLTVHWSLLFVFAIFITKVIFDLQQKTIMEQSKFQHLIEFLHKILVECLNVQFALFILRSSVHLPKIQNILKIKIFLLRCSSRTLWSTDRTWIKMAWCQAHHHRKNNTDHQQVLK